MPRYRVKLAQPLAHVIESEVWARDRQDAIAIFRAGLHSDVEYAELVVVGIAQVDGHDVEFAEAP